MRWFRFYSEVLDDPKVQRLPGDQYKLWVNLLCLANNGSPRGTLPSSDVMAFRLRISDEDMRSALDDFVERGLLDRDEDGTLRPHNWETRQRKSDNVTSRVQKHRAQRSGNVTETALEEEIERDTEAEAGNTPAPPPARDHPDDLVAVFLEAIGKADTRVPAAFRKASQQHCAWLVEQGFGIDQFRRYLTYRKELGRSMELRWIREDILLWAAEGEPSSPSRPPPRNDRRSTEPHDRSPRYPLYVDGVVVPDPPRRQAS